MSAFIYGRLNRPGGAVAESTDGGDDNKLIAAIAGLIPAEVLAGHALIVAATTKTDDAGVTTIINAGALKTSLPLLVALTAFLYILGRGIDLRTWNRADYARLLIAPVSFLVWTALIGTSALSPWVMSFDHASVTVAAVVLGIAIAAASAKLSPT